MNTPATILDQTNSSPDAAATDWKATRKVLESAELFWITTVRADGRPHVTPLVAVWADEAIHFHTSPGEQKEVNLRTNPHVVLTTGCNGWDGGLDVMVEGVALRVTDDAVLERLASVWATKWDGRWQLTAHDGCLHNVNAHDWLSHAYSVTPAKVFAHAKGDPFAATTHKF